MEEIENENVVTLGDDLTEEQRESIIQHLLKSEDDIENGRYRDAREVIQEWKEKYGI